MLLLSSVQDPVVTSLLALITELQKDADCYHVFPRHHIKGDDQYETISVHTYAVKQRSIRKYATLYRACAHSL